MILVHKDRNLPVEIGDKVRDSTGNIDVVTYFAKPHKPASSGKVTVENSMVESYVSGWGLVWLFREDQCDTAEEKIACEQLQEEFVEQAMSTDAEIDTIHEMMEAIHPGMNYEAMGFYEFVDRVGHVTMGDLADHPEEWAPRLHSFHWRHKK